MDVLTADNEGGESGEKGQEETEYAPHASQKALEPITVAFSHLKGGVGKTTAAINVSNCFARMGYKTLLVDMDPQSSSSEMFLDQNQPEKTLYHVLYEEVPLAEVTQNISDNLYLAPASIDMAMLENRLRERVDGYHMLQIALEKNDYDCVIIDTPALYRCINVQCSDRVLSSDYPRPSQLFRPEGDRKYHADVSDDTPAGEPETLSTGGFDYHDR